MASELAYDSDVIETESIFEGAAVDLTSMSSFADYAEILTALVARLAAQFDDVEFRETARQTCVCSRGIEFAVPRENMFGPRALLGTITELSRAASLLHAWNARHDDEAVRSYAQHIEDRVQFLMSRTEASATAC